MEHEQITVAKTSRIRETMNTGQRTGDHRHLEEDTPLEEHMSSEELAEHMEMLRGSGRSDITDFEEVVRLDKEYIENWSVWEDIKIILKISC